MLPSAREKTLESKFSGSTPSNQALILRVISTFNWHARWGSPKLEGPPKETFLPPHVFATDLLAHQYFCCLDLRKYFTLAVGVHQGEGVLPMGLPRLDSLEVKECMPLLVYLNRQCWGRLTHSFFCLLTIYEGGMSENN